MLRVAMLSVHTCPLAPLGGWESGGLNVYVRELSRYLSDLGLEIDVYTRRQDPKAPEVVSFAEGARVIHVAAGPAHYVPKEDVVAYLPEFVSRTRAHASRAGLTYDLIHAHYWLSGPVAGLLQRGWRIPTVAMFHTLARMKNQVMTSGTEREGAHRDVIEQRTMLLADRIVAATAIDRRHMLEHYDVPPHKISVVPGGVDLTRFRPGDQAAARRQLEIDGSHVLLFVGRIQRLKGIDLLLHAVSQLAALAPEVGDGLRVLIVGGRSGETDALESREQRRLSALVARLGLRNRVTLVGSVDQALLPTYYAAADITVVPSMYESFGLVAVESMACATPVVAARVGGLTTTVQDGVTGYLVPWRDPALYAERLALLLTNPSLRRQMGRNAVATAARYDWMRVAEEIYGIYCGLVRCERQAVGTLASRTPR
jgi:D-inositol-3-phosphate glycosyltransferase